MTRTSTCAAGIRTAQMQWARFAGVPLRSVPPVRPRPDYSRCYTDNLFEPLSSAMLDHLRRGDGNELDDDGVRPAKMAALHSSYAMACNFFHYWQWRDRPRLHALAGACSGPAVTDFRHLDVPQLLKHLLGLRRRSAERPAHLMYLYFDGTGDEGRLHREEVAYFGVQAAADLVGFSALSYQTVMARLDVHRAGHPAWFDYMTKRDFGAPAVV